MKSTREIFSEAVANVPDDVRLETDWSFAISDKIAEALEKQGLSQKDFAKKMGVEEAEVSCWLSGTHNFTIRTLARISAALGVEIIEICKGNLTNKAFGIAESISGELYYRTQISQLGCILDKSPFKIIDLEGVTFISRAAADELCTLAESRNLTLTGASGEAKEMLDLVADSRRADRVRNSESNIDTCGSMEELKRLLSD